MNFSEFLVRFKKQKNLTSTAELFKILGGEKNLGVKLRQFREIEAGKIPPSVPLFVSLYERIESAEKKDLVCAFMHTLVTLKGDRRGKEIPEYLEQSLMPPLEKGAKDFWDETKTFMTYSAEQLEFLTQNPDVLRLHKQVLLFDSVPISSSYLRKADLERMKELELVEYNSKEIRPSRISYKVPGYRDSGARQASKATDYILKHVDLYISKEGSPKQELSYACQMVSQSAAQRIREQMLFFKRWIQSLTVRENAPDSVPLVFMGFVKELEEREL
ncbi:MAG TPA: hypothetical protein DCS07_01330 [Bdellovibrionales bacterium]|nr:MAG: hypothetical protein A2Z97_04205 [Bdellovibrionales bacterium GWB1_52_6]OFZ02438.1 MAG: hypothetical protein A2X97_12880 [Bdellovibrionales bacterium GWA1_52_35]OFZ39325.1 MAG: hypothetical protein A2070_00660 [Bdellovibrionales bacterium GWC1_52_8]HAR41268.1 hypothetical protein [Bdellovibrionales bacterium]HCM41534.1 hypothetical protein [Bdellovibrionales bacterium]